METINNKIDLVVSFDTTGSMYPVLSQVRSQVEQFVKSMFSEFTDLRLGVIAHGDYCDKDDPYTIRIMDFTRDAVGLCKFIRETQKTYGGDADECYELVLNAAHKHLTWRDAADKIMVMIGDASPHGVNYTSNKDKLDWRKEADILAGEGIKVFAVHALAQYRTSSKMFYKTVANRTLGVYLTLDQFNEIVDLIKATVCQQGGEEKLNEFISIIKDSGRLTKTLNNNFRRLKGETVEEDDYTYRPHKSARTSGTEAGAIKKMDKLVPVTPGRFQIMTVDENCDIKGFVTKNGIEFKKGRGFYELSKAETVQQYKEVIMMDKETGEMFNGSQVREELGLQPQTEIGGVNERLHKDATKKFRVFVQSTSVNRKLIAGTTFLYEIADLEDTGTVIESKTETEVKETKAEVKETKAEVKETKAEVKETKAEVKETKAEVKETKAEVKKKVAKKKVRATKYAWEEPKIEEVETPKAESTTLEVDTDLADAISDSASLLDVTLETDKTEPKKKKSKKVTKTAEERKAEKAAKAHANAVKVTSERLSKDITKVTDAITRIGVSENKKNTEFAVNNLKKLIADATTLLDIFDK